MAAQNQLNCLSKTGALLIKRALEFYSNNVLLVDEPERLDPYFKAQSEYILSQLGEIIKYHEHTEANWYGPGQPWKPG